MSILIKKQSLPKEGEHYLIQINSDGTVYDAVGRRLACTAIELPPHGRLIDADALYKKLERIAKCSTGYVKDRTYEMMAVLQVAPTIIARRDC